MRTAIAVCLGLASGLFAFAMAAGRGGVVPGASAIGLAGAGLVGVVAAAGGDWLAHATVAADVDAAAMPGGLKILSGAAALLGLVQRSSSA